ncbi:DUF4124 domain-containing protein [Luteimonas arsenica]|uniref:DUF4124 domain-containing protein n=1 Tax=Luteimonas arsenica TaxID=1586242 RepID=UPI00105624C6|nr:DUF4124 domain-containing protein [Luteimonas arsenica]
MHRYVLGAVLAFAAAPALAQQTAGEVYQWKDANGVTHYSQTPPAQGRYEQRVITSSGAAAPTAAVEAKADDAAAGNPQCATARANVATLQAEGDVQIDAEGDGQLRVLNAEQRANQLELAQAAVKAYCTP